MTLLGTASVGKHRHIAERGAAPIDYRNCDFVARVLELTEGRGVDAVADPIGGRHYNRSLRCLTPRGTLVALGFSDDIQAGRRAVLARNVGRALGLKALAWPRSVKVYAFTFSPGARIRDCIATWNEVLRARESELLPPPLIGAELDLEQVSAAHEMLEGARHVGKIVLRCSGYEGP